MYPLIVLAVKVVIGQRINLFPVIYTDASDHFSPGLSQTQRDMLGEGNIQNSQKFFYWEKIYPEKEKVVVKIGQVVDKGDG